MTDPGRILDRCFEVLVERLRVLPDFELPRQRLKVVGQVSPDFELFAVSIPPSGIYPGLPGQPQRNYNAVTGGITGYAMDLNVVVLREVPNVDNAGRAPLGEDLAPSVKRATDDAKVLTETFNSALAAGELFDDCAINTFGGVTFDGPQGGMLGTILLWSVSL